MKNKNQNKIVFVAMSGGVDSSVAALLLKRQGLNVVGVFMRNWTVKVPGLIHCPWEEDQRFARQAAAQIGIPLYTWDFEKEYQEEVFKYFLESYKKGETPNPDVVCNKKIKFGLFLKKAKKLGADFIATGHYARLKRARIKNKELRIKKNKPSFIIRNSLFMAHDVNKDQSYFLWTLTQKQLKHCLFPLGDLTKPEVRKIAKRAGLVTAARKDSQGLCFVGPISLKEFLRPYLEEKSGRIVLVEFNKNGIKKERLIGGHRGVHLFTLGQRQGIRVGGGTPYYVAKKEIKKNILYVCAKKDLPKFFPTKIKIKQANWINSGSVRFPLKCRARYRYRQPLQSVKVIKNKTNKFEVVFTKPAVAITPGQSIVFYKNKTLLGGGVIE
ncbi:MAG: tRNA 2-thiouridine(34) synthase MnmA [Patescibacteria group bacterium]